MRHFFLFLIVIASCSLKAVVAEPVDDYIEQAQQLQLGKHSTWLALLHYKNEALTGRFISQADDPSFFKSPEGKHDPEAELIADLRELMAPPAKGHAQCMLPARWHWLKQQLDISTEFDVICPKLESWMNSVATDRLTLVFPAMYLGNPGSTFGHTFLRFDGDDSVMLSQTLNYAAAYDPEDSLPVYVSNGLFGGYQGVFLVRHYFETVQLYNNIENRDIWEYQLDYSPEEIRQLARHAWELTGIRFDYFFFRENCSYRLLGMLDAVKSEGKLTSGDAFPFYAIPVDTVRALDEKQLIINKKYRPSLASQVRGNLSSQSAELAEQVVQLVDGELSVEQLEQQLVSETDRVKVYEIAYTLMQFRDQAESPLAESILDARARLSQQANMYIEAPEPPELGHDSIRIALGGGEQNRQSYAEILFRPAFHDLVDAPLGYVAGSAINVMDVQLRWFPEVDELELESLRFFNIVSLTPVSSWYTTSSWLLDVRLDRTRMTAATSDLALVTRGGGGYSANWGDSTFFAMAVLEANISDDYDGDYSLLAGAQLGASILLGFGQALIIAETDESISGFDIDRDTASIELQYNLARNIALRTGYRLNRYEFFDDKDWFIRIHQYF